MTQASLNPLADESAAVLRHRLVSIFGGSIGNLIEWYDFYIYNFFALYFAKAFFPGSNPTAQLLNTFGIYALGFLIRPVGGWILGVMPTYGEIGVGAPLLLLAARLLQGISLGGEYGTSATYLSEVASARHRGFYSAFQYVTLIGGQLLASVVLLILQQIFIPAELEAWGWRIPFLIGAVCALYGFYLRRNLAETEDFKRAQALNRPNLITELLKHPREIAIVFGLTMGGTLAFYTYTTYMPTFLVNTVKLTRNQAAEISFITLFIYMCLQPVYGLISDKIGRRPVLLWFGIMGTLCTAPILYALRDTHDYTTALLLVMAALLIVSGYTSINAVVKAELFPAEVRALGVGLPYAIAVSLFGGTAPLIGLWFKDVGHETWFFWYITIVIFISLLVYALMRDTRDHSRITTG